MRLFKLAILPVTALITVACAPQLKPNTAVSEYLIIPGTTFIPTMLCGITAKGNACVSVKNGREVRRILKTDFKSWTKAYANDANNMRVPFDERQAFKLDKMFASQFLKALLKDESIRRALRRSNDDN